MGGKTASDKSQDGCESTILSYLRDANRPYSINDIHNNLQKTEGFSKSQVAKAVDNLVVAQKVKEKVYGKAKIFFVDQAQLEQVDDEQRKKMDEKLALLHQRINLLCAEMRPKEIKLSQLKRGLTLAQIREKAAALKKDNEQCENKLESLAAQENKVDPAEHERVKKRRRELIKEWKQRKRMAVEVVEALQQGVELPRAQLLEAVGIETDEDAGVSVPKIA